MEVKIVTSIVRTLLNSFALFQSVHVQKQRSENDPIVMSQRVFILLLGNHKAMEGVL